MRSTRLNKLVLLPATLTVFILAGCSVTSSTSSDQDAQGKPGAGNQVRWESVPSEFNPQIEELPLRIYGIEKIDLDLFGFDKDVEVIYTPSMAANSGLLRIFKVWKNSASWGGLNVSSRGNTIELRNYGTYQCAIKVRNGQIGELDGGCYVRLQVLLPARAEIEVYNLGKLITDRFIPIDAETLVKNVDRANWAQEKFAAIDDYLNSYANSSKRPWVTCTQLSAVIGDFMRSEEKLEALRRLNPFISDRENLPRMIDDKFSYFDRAKAREIVGLPAAASW